MTFGPRHEEVEREYMERGRREGETFRLPPSSSSSWRPYELVARLRLLEPGVAVVTAIEGSTSMSPSAVTGAAVARFEVALKEPRSGWSVLAAIWG